MKTYKERVIESLEKLGGHAYYDDIYEMFYSLSDKENLVVSWKSIIRATIERNSSDSQYFGGKSDLFYSVEGIGKGHWGLRNYKNSDKIELTQEDDEFSEGKVLLKKHLVRERNVKLIYKAKEKFKKQHGRLFCEICKFDFLKVYGKLGEDFIEAHHSIPVSQLNENDKTRLDDIIVVCSNCHSMLHRKKPWASAEELKKIIEENK